VHESAIERLAGSGVTRGCDDGKFCPRDAVTRGQMAAFIQRAMGLADAPGDTFTDDDASVFEGAIEALADRGIVEPCGPARYCPNDPMTREHMAVFLTRALSLPPSSADRFADDDRSAWEDEIQAFAAADITRGCDTTKYCPSDSVTREQMATFLVRAFGL
jgi:S-layer homology domain